MTSDGAQAQSTPPHLSPDVVDSSPAPAEHTASVHEPASEAVAASAVAWVRLDTAILLAAMLCAALLYFIRLGQPDQYIWDEVYHAYTAAELAQGNRDPYNPFANVPQADKDTRGAVTYEWTHPAFAKLPMQAGIRLFGDTAWGWRFSSALMGVIGIGVFWVLGRTMFGRQTALLATTLLLVDGLWFIESRLAMNDIFLVTFLLLAYLGFFLYLTRPADPVPAA